MSTLHVYPYINFQGRAREAMEFYRRLLGGSIELLAMGEQGAPVPAGPGHRVTSARLDAEGVVLTGSDGHPDFPPTVGDNMAITLSGTEKDQVAAMFVALAEGGKVKMPLTPQPSGVEVGWLIDQFGVHWQIIVTQG